MTQPERPGTAWGSVLAALVALGLGMLAAALMVAGHHPWDGPELEGLTQTHGIHQGDALAFVPLLVGAGLAWWCLRQRASS